MFCAKKLINDKNNSIFIFQCKNVIKYFLNDFKITKKSPFFDIFVVYSLIIYTVQIIMFLYHKNSDITVTVFESEPCRHVEHSSIKLSF